MFLKIWTPLGVWFPVGFPLKPSKTGSPNLRQTHFYSARGVLPQLLQRSPRPGSSGVVGSGGRWGGTVTDTDASGASGTDGFAAAKWQG